MAIVKFGKVETVGSSDLTTGKIYFETSTGLIKVAKSTTEVDVFGGNIKDATYSDNILTITKTDGSNITLNFSDIASASGVMAVFNEIKTTALKSVEGSTTADGSNVTVTLKNTTLDDKAQNKTFTIPVATESVQGTTTWAKIKELAKAEAETVAGSVYKVKGTKATIDEVLAVEDATIGDVYNVTAAFTLNSQKYPAGTNVVFVGPGEEGEPDPSAQAQWDALGGTIDLTPYETTEHAAATYATKEALTAVEDKADANTTAIGVLNGEEGSEGSVAYTAKDIVDREIAALDLSNTYEAKGAAEGIKATIDAYTVNGIAISTNPTLTGDNVKLSESYIAIDEYTVPVIGDKLDTAIAKLAKGIEDASAGGVQSIGGATGAITLKAGGESNGDINLSISGKELQATIVGLKSAAFVDTTAFDAAGKADSALASAKEYTDQLISWAEFE